MLFIPVLFGHVFFLSVFFVRCSGSHLNVMSPTAVNTSTWATHTHTPIFKTPKSSTNIKNVLETIVFRFGICFLDVLIPICSILELEAAMVNCICNILELAPSIFQCICKILVLKLFILHGILQLGIARVHLRLAYSCFKVYFGLVLGLV